MKLLISNSSKIPIYEQIKESIISQILDGSLEEGEQLPSIRVLAKDLKISVMTVKKSYDQLEAAGYIVTQPGKGSYVSTMSSELAKENKQKEIEEYIFRIVDISKKYNISKDEIIDLFDFAYRSE